MSRLDLRRSAEEYLALRRALGFKLYHETWFLPDFVAFLAAHGSSVITTELAVRWATAAARHILALVGEAARRGQVLCHAPPGIPPAHGSAATGPRPLPHPPAASTPPHRWRDRRASTRGTRLL
jgi:hypothetical protein